MIYLPKYSEEEKKTRSSDRSSIVYTKEMGSITQSYYFDSEEVLMWLGHEQWTSVTSVTDYYVGQHLYKEWALKFLRLKTNSIVWISRIYYNNKLRHLLFQKQTRILDDYIKTKIIKNNSYCYMKNTYGDKCPTREESAYFNWNFERVQKFLDKQEEAKRKLQDENS